MGTESSHQERSNYDEILMQHKKTFTDNLKELKNLRKQLYSAAEYFEVSYGKDEHKQELVDTMKVYVSKAVISTVDHLGSVAAKLDTLLDEKVCEFSATKLRFSCVEQLLNWISADCFFVWCIRDQDHAENSSTEMASNNNHLSLFYPSSDEDTVSYLGKSNMRTPMMTILYPGRDDMHQYRHQQGFLATTTKEHPTLPRRRLQNSPTFTQPSPNPLAFSFTRAESSKDLDSKGKRSVSPLRFLLKRSESYIPKSPRSSTCNLQQGPPQPQRTISMPIRPAKATSLQSNKTKRTLKSLLSLQFTD
nr:protein ABIL2-like isoform X1 [Ipomoea batatas]